MEHSFYKNNNTSSSSNKYPEGVFVNKVSIVEIQNAKSEYHDISINVTAQPENFDGKTYFYVNGNHYKDKGVSVDWGTPQNEVKSGSWKVKAFLQALGMDINECLEADLKGLTEEFRNNCVGKSCYILQYHNNKLTSNGNPKRSTWFYYATEAQGADWLREKWAKQSSPPNDYKAKPTEKLGNLWNNQPTEEDIPN